MDGQEKIVDGCPQTITAPQERVRSPGLAKGLLPLVKENSYQIAAIALLLILWEVLGRTQDLLFLPPFTRVLAAWWELFQKGQMISNLGASLLALAAGFSLSVVTGLATGILMGLSKRFESLLDIYVNAFLATPSILLVPVFFILFGMGDMTRVAVVFWYSYFIIVINTCCAIRTVDQDLVEMARSFGADGWQLLWKVRLPDALPLIMAGLRLGVGRAVKGMINGEMFIALVGLGAMVRIYAASYDVERLFAVILNILVVALIAIGIVQAIDRRLTRWEESAACRE
jgi:NitT/TauT family transport system permease protein